MKNYLDNVKNKSLKISITIHAAILLLLIVASLIPLKPIPPIKNETQKNIEKHKIDIVFSSLKSKEITNTYTEVTTESIKNIKEVKNIEDVKDKISEEKPNDKNKKITTTNKKKQKTPPINKLTQKENNSENQIWDNEKNNETKLLNEIQKIMLESPYKKSNSKNTQSKSKVNEKDSYISKIQQKIYFNWNQKYGERGWKCRIQIFQNKEGIILDHNLLNCHKNEDFQNSVIDAIYISSPLPTPDNMENFDSIIDLIFIVD